MNVSEIAQFRSSLRKIERFLFKNLKVDQKCCSITFNECHILMEVTEAEEISQSELISLMGLDKSAITRAIDKMVRKGYLNRSEQLHDRRKKMISSTEKGIDLANQVNHHMNEKFRQFFVLTESNDQKKITNSVDFMANMFDKWDRTGGKGDKCC